MLVKMCKRWRILCEFFHTEKIKIMENPGKLSYKKQFDVAKKYENRFLETVERNIVVFLRIHWILDLSNLKNPELPCKKHDISFHRSPKSILIFFGHIKLILITRFSRVFHNFDFFDMKKFAQNSPQRLEIHPRKYRLLVSPESKNTPSADFIGMGPLRLTRTVG